MNARTSFLFQVAAGDTTVGDRPNTREIARDDPENSYGTLVTFV
jgi:hypothetical protein